MHIKAESFRYQLLGSLRGLAAFWVVCFHILAEFREQYGTVFNHLIKNGDLGVEVFFVISGYGLSVSVHNKFSQGISNYSYAKRRISRIYLTYLASLLFAAVVIPILCALLSAIKTGAITIQFFPYTALEWMHMVFLTKVFSANTWELNQAFLPLNGAFWYIAIIVQIYLVVVLGAFSKRLYYILIVIVTFLGLGSLFPAAKELLPPGLFLPFWPEFAVGVGLYQVIARGWILGIKNAQSRAVYCIIWTIFLVSTSLILYFWFSKPVFAVIVGVFLWLLRPMDAILSASRLFRILRFMGSFSYSLYLMHFPLWPMVDILVRNLIPLPLYFTTPLVLIPLVIILAFLWYLFFEKPGSFMGILRAWRRPFITILQGIKPRQEGPNSTVVPE